MLLMEESKFFRTNFQTSSGLEQLSRKMRPFLSFQMHHMIIPGKAFQIVLMILFLNVFWFHSTRVLAGWPLCLSLLLKPTAPLSQMAAANGKLSRRWFVVSSTCKHKQHRKGPWSPRFLRFSPVRMRPLTINQAKVVTLGHKFSVQILFHSSPTSASFLIQILYASLILKTPLSKYPHLKTSCPSVGLMLLPRISSWKASQTPSLIWSGLIENIHCLRSLGR